MTTPGALDAPEPLTEAERGFLARVVRRERVFLALSAAGVAAGLGLAAYYGYRRLMDPGYALGLRAVVVVLVLLGARHNLRQYRAARILAKLRPPGRSLT